MFTKILQQSKKAIFAIFIQKELLFKYKTCPIQSYQFITIQNKSI